METRTCPPQGFIPLSREQSSEGYFQELEKVFERIVGQYVEHPLGQTVEYCPGSEERCFSPKTTKEQTVNLEKIYRRLYNVGDTTVPLILEQYQQKFEYPAGIGFGFRALLISRNHSEIEALVEGIEQHFNQLSQGQGLSEV